MKTKISIIAAIGKNRELGKNNKLLWHIAEDLKRFRKLTQGHAVIMGRKTFESLGKPLPNRLNIVVTRQRNFLNIEKARYSVSRLIGTPPPNSSGSLKSSKQVSLLSPGEKIAFVLQSLIACFSLEKAIETARSKERNEIFIIGGGQIYKQGIKYADKLYLTIVEKKLEADTYFPDYSEFKKIIFKEKHQSNDYSFTFLELER